jgi:hypothetical protein
VLARVLRLLLREMNSLTSYSMEIEMSFKTINDPFDPAKKSPELVGKAPLEVDPSIDAEEAFPQLRRVVG